MNSPIILFCKLKKKGWSFLFKMTTSTSPAVLSKTKSKIIIKGTKKKATWVFLGKPGSWEISSGFCLFVLLSMSKIRKRVFKRATAVSTAIRITWNNYIENYTQTAVINIVNFRIFKQIWLSVCKSRTCDHFWKCILTSIRKNAKAHNVYQRCLFFIFD